MPERPLLILPNPGPPLERVKRRQSIGKTRLPSRQRQEERLSPKFTRLQEAFEERRVRLQMEAAGIRPEEVLVLETVGPVGDIIAAVQNLEMEWLGEREEEAIEPDDDFFALDREGRRIPDKTLRGQVYIIFSNLQALNQMLSLWRQWEREVELPFGLRKWKKIFAHLRDIHPWGVKERLLETGVLDDWKERVEHNEEFPKCEIELWFRQQPNVRTAARDRVVELVTAVEGRVLSESVIEDIEYHSLLAELPISAVED